MEKFLQTNSKIIGRDYVELKIDTAEMENGDVVAKRLRKSRTGGIPWMVILDAEGKELISSDGPQGNCGYPLQPHEIEHFLSMVRKTADRTSEQHLEELKKSLDDYRKAREQRRRQESPE